MSTISDYFLLHFNYLISALHKFSYFEIEVDLLLSPFIRSNKFAIAVFIRAKIFKILVISLAQQKQRMSQSTNHQITHDVVQITKNLRGTIKSIRTACYVTIFI